MTDGEVGFAKDTEDRLYVGSLCLLNTLAGLFVHLSVDDIVNKGVMWIITGFSRRGEHTLIKGVRGGDGEGCLADA